MPKSLNDFLNTLPPEMRAKVSHLPGQQQANAKINQESVANLFEVTLDVILNQVVCAATTAANAREKRSLIRGASVALCYVSVLRSVMLELLPEGGPRESTHQVALGGFRDELKRFEKTVVELLPAGIAVRKRALEREAAGLPPETPLPGEETGLDLLPPEPEQSNAGLAMVEPLTPDEGGDQVKEGDVLPMPQIVSPELEQMLDAANERAAAAAGIPADELAKAPQ